jgi:ATP-dependent Clp protease ATP-binding subunit ClpC
VILFDEIEKANPEVWNSLIQILDDVRLTDGQGHQVDFRNTVLIMTSNLGTEFVKKGGTLGFLSSDSDERDAHENIEKALKSTFRPEFINRVDEIIMFSPLTVDQVKDIVILQMKEIQDRLQENGIKVELSETARDWLANEGYDSMFGARPLRRALQKFVESPLSVSILAGEFHDGDVILVDLNTESNKLEFLKKEKLKETSQESE